MHSRIFRWFHKVKVNTKLNWLQMHYFIRKLKDSSEARHNSKNLKKLSSKNGFP